MKVALNHTNIELMVILSKAQPVTEHTTGN